MIRRVFFDADVLIAGSASTTGASFLLLQLAELNFFEGITCRQVVEECTRNLTRKIPQALPLFKQILAASLIVVDDPAAATVHSYAGMAHAKDLPILTAAIEQKADVLVTFNVRHFHPSQEPGLLIATPGNLLTRLRHQLAEL